MKVTYTPAEGDRQEWLCNLDRIPRSRAVILQKLFGARRTWAEFYGALLGGDAEAQAIILWHCMSTDHPGLRYADLPDYAMGELQMRYTQPEYERLIDGIENTEDLAPAEKAAGIEFYRARIAALDLAETEAEVKAGVEASEGGKDAS